MGTPLDVYSTTVVVNSFRILAAILSSLLLLRLPRRFLHISTGTVICLTLAALGTYCYLDAHDILNPDLNLNWIPMVGVTLVFVFATIGYGNVAFVLVGELFPAKARTFGNSFIVFFHVVSSSIAVKSAPSIRMHLGMHGMLWLCSTVVACMLVVAAVFMPETKGLSLQEIEESFNRKSKSNKTTTI